MDIFGIAILWGHLATNFFIGLSAILISYWYAHKNHDYWKRRGIPFVKPTPFFGSVLENLRKPLADIEYRRYFELGPVYGHFERSRPLLSVGDPKLLRKILLKDFRSFSTRREFSCNDDVIDNMLVSVQGENWKRIRTIVSPVFTSGKLKRMMGILKECSRTLTENFKRISEEGKSIDAKKLFGAFSMDVMASSAFSTKIGSHHDPENAFVRAGAQTFRKIANWRYLVHLLFPFLSKSLGISVRAPDLNLFKETTLQIIEERKRNGQTRNDFLQLLMDVAEEADKDEMVEMKSDAKEEFCLNQTEGAATPKQPIFKNLSMNEVVAQCVIFFLAGYDTVSTVLSCTTYCLALNEDVQDKLRTEVDKALQKNNGELTYETLQEMKYLEKVVFESLRMYPPLARIERMAVVDYSLSEYGITIPKGMVISVPIYPIQRDPKHYPNPDLFDPDRFSVEEKVKRDSYAFIPFMAGPRNCVARRFALMEIKVCLIHVIRHFIIKKCPQTKIPLEFGISRGVLMPKEISVSMELRKDPHLIRPL